jgi:hypothetical protein
MGGPLRSTTGRERHRGPMSPSSRLPLLLCHCRPPSVSPAGNCSQALLALLHSAGNRRDYRRCAMQPESSTNSIACMSLWLCNDTKVSIRRLQKRFAVIGADKRVEFVREIKKKKRKNLHWLSTITLWKSHGTQIFFINWLGTHGRHPK